MKFTGYDITDLGPEHNTQILELLKGCPIETGYMTLVFDRQPDFFLLPDLRYDQYKYKGCVVNGQLKGVFLMASHKGYIHGSPTPVYYLGNAFLTPDMRRKAFIANAGAEFFAQSENIPEIGYSLILKKNKRAESYIGKTSADYPQLPDSRVIADFVARTIPLLLPKRYKEKKFEIRQADRHDIPYLAARLNAKSRNMSFGPVYTQESLQEMLLKRPGFSISDFSMAYADGQPVGFCSAWDASAIRQTRVLKFGRKFIPILLAYRMVSLFSTIPPLPVKGEALHEMHIGHVYVNKDDPEVFYALLSHVYHNARSRGMHTMLWGSHSKDPLLGAIRRFTGIEIRSNIVAVSTRRDILAMDYPSPFIDTTFL